MDQIGNPILKELLAEAPSRDDNLLNKIQLNDDLLDGPNKCRPRSIPFQIDGTDIFQDRNHQEVKQTSGPLMVFTKTIIEKEKGTLSLGNVDSLVKKTSSEELCDLLGEGVTFMESPLSERDLPLFCFASALLPVLPSQSQDARSRCLQKVRLRLGYDLDELDKYSEFKYQKDYKKSDMQSALLSKNAIWKPWILRYLSDYFQLNAIVICHNLLVYSSYNKNRASIIMKHDRRKLSLLTGAEGNSLFDSKLVDRLFVQKKVHLNKLLAQSRYKSNEIKVIAEALEINTQKVGRNQSRRKDDIYLDVKTVLNWLV
jgi:hypothetical protein